MTRYDHFLRYIIILCLRIGTYSRFFCVVPGKHSRVEGFREVWKRVRAHVETLVFLERLKRGRSWESPGIVGMFPCEQRAKQFCYDVLKRVRHSRRVEFLSRGTSKRRPDMAGGGSWLTYKDCLCRCSVSRGARLCDGLISSRRSYSLMMHVKSWCISRRLTALVLGCSNMCFAVLYLCGMCTEVPRGLGVLDAFLILDYA